MGFFKKKKRDFIDLTRQYEKQKEQLENMNLEKREVQEVNSGGTENSGFVSLFGENTNFQNQNLQENENYPDTVNPDEKRRRLAKRLKEMTDKLENLSNQIYHLSQRLEVVEKKLEVGRY